MLKLEKIKMIKETLCRLLTGIPENAFLVNLLKNPVNIAISENDSMFDGKY